MPGSDEHAIVKVSGYEIPLIGVPENATLEECDCCGNTIGLSDAIFTGKQILCKRCSSESEQLTANRIWTQK